MSPFASRWRATITSTVSNAEFWQRGCNFSSVGEIWSEAKQLKFGRKAECKGHTCWSVGEREREKK